MSFQSNNNEFLNFLELSGIIINHETNIEKLMGEFNQQQQEQQTAQKPTNKRKRMEVTPRQVGRPTTVDTLIKIEGEDDIEVLQLNSRELILAGSDGQEGKKSKTILTKNKNNIVCTNNKQYVTYEMFADARKKALEIIKKQRDMLYKINVAENVLINALKK